MRSPLPVFLGWDDREEMAYRTAEWSLRRHATQQVWVRALNAQALWQQRLLWRPVYAEEGQRIDHLSGTSQSTDFAVSRFLVPFLGRSGWALFTDCDVVFLDDVAKLFECADRRYAVMCVKHPALRVPSSKMDDQVQRSYPRKLWSSVMLVNCAHPAHFRLSLAMVNQYPRELLHQFCWLLDEEIGELPPEWNWLVGLQPRPPAAKLAHFTLGGPWLQGWPGAEHDGLWQAANEFALDRIA